MNHLFSYFSKLNKTQAAAMVIAAACVAIAAVLLLVPVDAYNDSQIKITVPDGSSLNSIAGILNDAGLIRNKFVFIWYVRSLGEGNTLQAGDYIFSKSFSAVKIAAMLAQGLAANDIQITVPEGSNIWQVDDVLYGAGLIVKGSFAQKFSGREGYLFPDTYRFKKMAGDNRLDEIYGKMTDDFNAKTGEIFKDLSVQEQKEVVIIASILEKEAKTENDMRLISGIIQKRLKMGISLQIDATVAYGACQRSFQFSVFSFQKNKEPIKDCDVSQVGIGEEVHVDSPYNSYKRAGLPAGPISNPGLTAIDAALHPLASDYLYYLSARDGSRIIYAKTSAEQTANRAKYLGL